MSPFKVYDIMRKIYLTSFFIISVQYFEQILGEHTEELLSDIIINLNTKLKIELNIYINEPPKDYRADWQRRLATFPSLLLDEDYSSNVRIHDHFTQKVLTVFFMNSEPTNHTVHVLVQVLWKLHFTDILLVSDAGTVPDMLLPMFQESWRNGFTNMLTIVGDKIYTYHPFPTIELVTLQDINEYHNKTYMKNFQRYAIHSSISHNSPRTYKYRNRDGQVVYAGYMYRLLLTFIKHHNGTFVEVPISTYGFNVTELVAAFQAKNLDILAALLYMYPNYSHSIVLCNYGTYLMVPYAQPIQEYWCLLRPLSGLLWLLTVLCFVYYVPSMCLLQWLGTGVLDFSASLLRITKAMLSLPGHADNLEGRVQAFYIMLPFISGFLLTNIYQSSLASIFVTPLFEPQIDTIADISRTDLRIPQMEMDEDYLRRQSGLSPIVYQRVRPSSALEVHNWITTLNTSSIHMAFEDKVNFLLYQQKFLEIPYMKRIDEPLYQMPVFLALPHGSPFLKLLNCYLRRVYDSGVFRKLISDSAEEGVLSGEIKFFKTDFSAFHPLSLHHFLLLFFAWSAGLVLGIICFGVEMARFKIYAFMCRAKNIISC